MNTLMIPFAYMGETAPEIDCLSTLIEFGTNPESLKALIYIPENLPEGAPLVPVTTATIRT